MKYIRCKAHIDAGRCRRKAEWRRAYCPAHQRAHDEAEKAEAEVRDLATELCCAIGEVSLSGIASKGGYVQLGGEKLDTYRALYAANERLQSALVARSSPGGVDPDADEVTRG